MYNILIESFSKLKKYCEQQNFKGWDPYDGLNSKIFRSLPFFKKSALARLIVIQGFKRFPFNLRKIALVPKEYNAKGIGLLLSGYCNLYKFLITNPDFQKFLGKTDDIKGYIFELADILLSLRSIGNYHGDCWGYNFDWQARRLFLFPKNTPTVVATFFCATSLFNAYEVTNRKEYLDSALSSANFIIEDLHRTPYKSGFLFSYSPLPGNDTVFNASLLGAALLAECYKYEKKEIYKELALTTLKACCEAQNKDGSWVYGCLPVQNWIDSFHTGYNLMALQICEDYFKDFSFNQNIKIGFDYYIKNFFERNGLPKYYNDKAYPIDIHCPGQLFVTLSYLKEFFNYENLVDKVLDWTVKNMQNKKGYFYYQLKKGISSKISYMRWSNAFMFNALSYLLPLETKINDNP